MTVVNMLLAGCSLASFVDMELDVPVDRRNDVILMCNH